MRSDPATNQRPPGESTGRALLRQRPGWESEQFEHRPNDGDDGGQNGNDADY